MKGIVCALGIFVISLASGCYTIGKKSPGKLVLEASFKRDNGAVLEAVQSGSYTRPEIQEIAQKAIDNRLCSLAYELTIAYQLYPNLKSEYQSLFQCLMLEKQYDAALTILQQGAKPDFIKEERYDRNDALEEAAAWGVIDVVEELIRLDMKPTSKAFYLGVSGHYHRSYETSVKLVDLFKPFISSFDMEYIFVSKPLLYEVATERKFNVEQRCNLSKILLENGANPNKGVKKTEYGSERDVDYIETAYMAVRGVPQLTVIFLVHGANPEFEKMSEKARFLANMKPGDSARQGLIVEIRNDLVLLQDSSKQFWVKLVEVEPAR